MERTVLDSPTCYRPSSIVSGAVKRKEYIKGREEGVGNSEGFICSRMREISLLDAQEIYYLPFATTDSFWTQISFCN
jgi:hypothetical protein